MVQLKAMARGFCNTANYVGNQRNCVTDDVQPCMFGLVTRTTSLEGANQLQLFVQTSMPNSWNFEVVELHASHCSAFRNLSEFKRKTEK